MKCPYCNCGELREASELVELFPGLPVSERDGFWKCTNLNCRKEVIEVYPPVHGHRRLVQIVGLVKEVI